MAIVEELAATKGIENWIVVVIYYIVCANGRKVMALHKTV